MACLSCQQRAAMISRAITAAKAGDRASVNREMQAMGRSFRTDAATVADQARSKIAKAMSSRPGN